MDRPLSDPALEARLARLERELRELRALVQPAPPSGAPDLSRPAWCAGCGRPLTAAARFCAHCGAPVAPAGRPAAAPAPPASSAPPPTAAPAPPVTPPPAADRRAAEPPATRPPAPASRPPAPPRPPRRPLRALVPHISTTMVLAWMGGVIAVLGLTFLFVLAARRGWFFPPLRLAVGLAVSGGLLGFAVWFHHRRAGRYHAVLAAAGAGIAGLYATLFAAAEMYHYLNRPAALACAGAIAVLSTLVALDVDAEPLAVFGVPAAILAPLLVAREVTPLGLAFGALIGVAALVCMQRRRWVWLTVGVLVVGLPQVLWLAATTDSGFGLWMLGPLLFAALWAATMFLYAVRRAAPRHLDQLTLALASAAFAALVATALRAGHGGQVLGTGRDGWLVLAVAVLLMAGAFLPWRLDRAHPDLADLLGAYSLTALALAIGLLLDGSGRACGWAAEAGALAVVGLRVRGRGAGEPGVLRRADRLHAGATVYLVPALVEMVALARPQQALTIAEWGSHRGLVGLAGVALGAAVWAGVAMRTSNWPAWRLW